MPENVTIQIDSADFSGVIHGEMRCLVESVVMNVAGLDVLTERYPASVRWTMRGRAREETPLGMSLGSLRQTGMNLGSLRQTTIMRISLHGRDHAGREHWFEADPDDPQRFMHVRCDLALSCPWYPDVDEDDWDEDDWDEDD